MTKQNGFSAIRRAVVAATGITILAASTLAPGVAMSRNTHNSDAVGAGALVGTWRVTVTTYPCANPQATNPPFVSLLTFGEDGSLIETTSSMQFQPGQRSIGHGRWERIGLRAYRAVSEAFVQFATNPAPLPPAPALQRGRQRIDQGIQMTSRDHFVSDASVAFINSPADNGAAPYFSACATATADRFE
jgi:hypothetical protein